MAEAKAACSRCGAVHEVSAVQSINAVTQPELKASALDGSLFTWKCPDCGTLNLVKYPLLYHDPSQNLILIYTDSESNLNASGLPEGYTGRIVSSVSELIEKIKIFDAGLDDIVMEMVKYVTCNEMGHQEALRFLKTEGADGDLVLTYPKDGKMEMLAVGCNVYQDCAGICSRNPHLTQAASGLCHVDQAWLADFLA